MGMRAEGGGALGCGPESTHIPAINMRVYKGIYTVSAAWAVIVRNDVKLNLGTGLAIASRKNRYECVCVHSLGMSNKSV